VLVLANGEAQADAAVGFIGTFTSGNTPDVGWRVMKLAVDIEGAKVEVHRR
jgi:homoserine kinase